VHADDQASVLTIEDVETGAVGLQDTRH